MKTHCGHRIVTDDPYWVVVHMADVWTSSNGLDRPVVDYYCRECGEVLTEQICSTTYPGTAHFVPDRFSQPGAFELEATTQRVRRWTHLAEHGVDVGPLMIEQAQQANEWLVATRNCSVVMGGVPPQMGVPLCG